MNAHRQLVQNLIEQLPGSTLIETHISSVILTDHLVYKLKKPVDFGFLDFSTLEKRKEYCEEEVRINGRFAPVLEYEVVAIGGSVESPVLGAGSAIEYTVRMLRFEQSDQLDHVAAAGGLDEALVDKIADRVAALHEHAVPAEPETDFGTPQRVLHPVTENFALLERSLFPETAWEKVQEIKEWSLERHGELEEFFAGRKTAGKVRECHGDLHLHNITLVDDEVTPFDAIEFNPYFRWIDVISDLAFLLMDLEYFGQKALANRLLNRYLELTGDYEALKALSFYQCYRAMVRVKVTALRLGQEGTDETEKAALLDEIERYLDLALGYTRPVVNFVALMYGLSGSGKSYASLFACGLSGGIRVRSDAERKRMFGEGAYSGDATEATYDKLAQLAGIVSDAGYPVFVDATFLKRWQRDRFAGFARRYILECRCDESVALARIARREAEGKDPSEADQEVYFMQKASLEPLGDEGNAVHVVIDCNDDKTMRLDLGVFVDHDSEAW